MEKSNLGNPFPERFQGRIHGFLRTCLVLVSIHVISFLLGFGIFFIVFGIQIALSRILIYWPPTRNWLMKTLEMQLPQVNKSQPSKLYVVLVNIFHALIAILFFALGVYVIKIGIGILAKDGFLGQNFIYLIFFR
jgi:hypothetical protein